MPQGDSEYIHHTYNVRASPWIKTDSQSRNDSDLNTSLHRINTDMEQFYRPLRLSYLQHTVDIASAQNSHVYCWVRLVHFMDKSTGHVKVFPNTRDKM
jgi:hypothetical protein